MCELANCPKRIMKQIYDVFDQPTAVRAQVMVA